MTEVGAQLPNQKRDQIFRSALREFAEKGYESASTNSITDEAGISKGLLFHYFGSKKDLYLSVLDHCVRYYQAFYEHRASEFSSDIFDRMLQASALKIEMLRSSPDTYRVLTEAFVNTPGDIGFEVLEIRKKALTEGFATLCGGLDLSRLRNGIEPSRVLELLMAVSEALISKYIAVQQASGKMPLDVMPAVIDEFREAIQIIKHGAYEPDM